MTPADHLVYAFLWAVFGALHSILASETIKSILSSLGRAYRLTYNGFAVVHIAITVWIGEYVLGAGSETLISGNLVYFFYAVAGVGVIVLLAAMRLYDGGRFMGFTQLRNPHVEEDEPLRLEGLHRYIRHPLYSGAILVLWGRVGSEAELATAVWATLYFIVGARFEERRLIERYGDAYRHYREKVPGFVPWKGRVEVSPS